MNEKKQQQLLHYYLEKIEAGEITYKEAFQQTKNLDRNLYSLLRKTLHLHKYQQQATPDQYYKQSSQNRIWYQLSDTLQETQQQAPARRYPPKKAKSFNFQPFLTATLAVLFSFIVMVGGAQAADTAAPGDALYPVDLWMENSRIALTNNAVSKLTFMVANSEERVGEANDLFQKGDFENGYVALDYYEQKIQAINVLLSESSGDELATMEAIVAASTAANTEVLNSLMGILPPQAQEAILHALEVSDHTDDATPTLTPTEEALPGDQTEAAPTATPSPTDEDEEKDNPSAAEEVLEGVEEAKATKDAEKEEDKQDKEDEKATKEAEKEEDKQDKEDEKEEDKQDKEDDKATKEAEKEEDKDDKDKDKD